MKILFCSSTFLVETHGPSKFAKLLLRINNIYKEHEIRILTPDTDVEQKDLIYKLRVIKWPRFIGVLWLHLDNFVFYQKVKQIRKEYEFDVLIFNNMAQALWSRIRLPKTVKVGGFVHGYDYVARSCLKIEFNKQWFIDISRRPFEKMACRHCDFVVTNSRYVTEKILNNYQIELNKVLLLYKSIDFDETGLKKTITLSDNISILFVKYDFMVGGLFTLIEALGYLKLYNFNLLVVGPPKKDHNLILSRCKNRANIKCLTLGSLKQEEVFKLMAKSDIFCVPSFMEALGVANIEALYTGIPVVSSDAGGIPEVLDYGNNGWLSEAGNPYSLAKAIEDCITNEEERIKKVENGRAFVKEHFDHRKMLEKFIAILESVVNE